MEGKNFGQGPTRCQLLAESTADYRAVSVDIAVPTWAECTMHVSQQCCSQRYSTKPAGTKQLVLKCALLQISSGGWTPHLRSCYLRGSTCPSRARKNLALPPRPPRARWLVT